MQVQTFKDTAAFFDAILGPAQHDKHVQAYRWHLQHIADTAFADAADERLRKCNAEWIAAYRARVAS